MENIKLRGEEFNAIILDNSNSDNLDDKLQGRYKVHIPDLMPHIPEDQGIFVKNHVHKWRITSGKYGEYGQYFPLQPFTKVIVKFHKEDFNSGYIDRIVSDFTEKTDVLAQDCVEEKSVLLDRDEQTILFKTPKLWNSFYINEETDKEPNTIYFIYNRDKDSKYTEREVEKDRNRRTVIRVDETGIHIWSHDNFRMRIKLDENKHISRDQTEYIEGFRTKHVGQDDDLHVHQNQRINIDKNQDRWIKKDRTTNIDENDQEHIGKERRTLIDKDNHNIIHQNRFTKIDQNEEIHILQNELRKIDSNFDQKISGNKTENISGNSDLKISGNHTIEISGNCNISVSGNVNINAGGTINADAPMINLNCGTSSYISANSSKDPKDAEYNESKPTPKYEAPYIPSKEYTEPVDHEDSNHRYDSTWTKDGLVHSDISKARTRVRDLGPNETKDYEMDDKYSGNDKDKGERLQVVGKKCDDVTNDYNIEYRESLNGKEYYNGD